MIEVDNIVKEFFGTRGEIIRAVDGLSFQCARGELYGLLGPNGAGKTTTLRILGGLMSAKSGRITVDGFDVSKNKLDVRRRVGYMAASTGMYERLTGLEFLRYTGSLYNIGRDMLSARIDTLVDMLDMRTFIDRRTATLSTGQKQRVNLARTLVHDPPILILDEPTMGLDVISNRVVLRFIIRMVEQGRTVIVSTHHMADAERICHRVGLIHKGRMAAEGSPEELRRRTGLDNLADIFLKVIGVPGLDSQSLTAGETNGAGNNDDDDSLANDNDKDNDGGIGSETGMAAEE